MDSTPTWDLPAPFTLDVTVGDDHIDMMRHTNNVVYLTWLEGVAWAHSVQLGLGPAEYEAEAHGLVVREHRLRYEAATRFGEVVRLATWITQVDRLSLHRRFQFVRVADGKTVFRAETHYVCVDIAEGRVRRMPAIFLDTYRAAVTPAPGGAQAPESCGVVSRRGRAPVATSRVRQEGQARSVPWIGVRLVLMGGVERRTDTSGHPPGLHVP